MRSVCYSLDYFFKTQSTSGALISKELLNNHTPKELLWKQFFKTFYCLNVDSVCSGWLNTF